MTRDEAILHQIVTDGDEPHSEGTLRAKWSLIAETIKYQLGMGTACLATHLCEIALMVPAIAVSLIRQA